MASTIGTLNAILGLNTTAFTAGTKKARGSMRSLEVASKRMGTMLKGALAFAGVAGFKSLITGALSAADSIDKLSRQVGLSAEAYQVYAHAAKLSGIETAALDTSLRALGRRSGEAQAGIKTYVDGFAALGISVEDLRRLTPDQLFLEVAEGVSKLGSQAERLAASDKVFSETGRRLVVMFEQGKIGIEEYAKQARELGLILSNDVVAGAAATKDQLENLSAVISKNFQQGLLEGFTGEFDNLAALMKDKAFQEGVAGIGLAVGKLARQLEDAAYWATVLGAGLVGGRLGGPLGALLGAGGAAFIPGEMERWGRNSERARLGEEARSGGSVMGVGRPRGMPGYDWSTDARSGADGAGIGGGIVGGIGGGIGGGGGGTDPAGELFARSLRANHQFETAMKDRLDTYRETVIELGSIEELFTDEYFKQVLARNQEESRSLQGRIYLMDELRFSMMEIGSTAVFEFDKIGESVGNVLQHISRLIVEMYVLKPLIESIMGPAGSPGGGLVGSAVNSLLGVPALADGGPINGPAIVGERGPELFVPGRSGTIIPNGVGGVTQNIFIDAAGADAGAADRIEATINRLRSEMSGIAVMAVTDAKRRGIIRGNV